VAGIDHVSPPTTDRKRRLQLLPWQDER